MSLWADDANYRTTYCLPGQPARHGQQAIRDAVTPLMTSLRKIGATDTSFDFTTHCDPTAVSDPKMAFLVGAQSLTMGGKTEKSHGMAAMVKVGDQWKMLCLGVINATPQLHAMMDALPPPSRSASCVMATPSQLVVADIEGVFDSWGRAMLSYSHTAPSTHTQSHNSTGQQPTHAILHSHFLFSPLTRVLSRPAMHECLVRWSDVELIMSLWAEDGQYRTSYLLPGQPAFHGKQAIRDVVTSLMSSLRKIGATDTSFDFTTHCDPTAVSDPKMAFLVGAQSLTMGGKTEKSHGMAAVVKVGGQWKILSIAVVNTTPQLKAMVDELNK